MPLRASSGDFTDAISLSFSPMETQHRKVSAGCKTRENTGIGCPLWQVSTAASSLRKNRPISHSDTPCERGQERHTPHCISISDAPQVTIPVPWRYLLLG